jgi:hypothetical protein
MDAGGGQHFFAEMNRLGNSNSAQLPDHLLPDTQPIDPLAEFGPVGRARLLAQWARQRYRRIRVPNASLYDRLPGRPADSRRSRFLHRIWSAETVRRMLANAKRNAPAGPALYSRYLAGCVLRAVHELHEEHGCALPVYDLVFPMALPGLARRPVVGNYLASPSFRVSADLLADKRALAEEIDRQLRTYMERRSYLAEWALRRITAQLRVSQYRRLMEYHLRDQPVVTGFAFVGDVDPPVRQFLGAEVSNLWGGGVFCIPPGWNPVFSRFGNKLNLAVFWPEGAFPEEVVWRYADLIEHEAIDG